MKLLSTSASAALILALALGQIGCIFGNDDDPSGDESVILRVDATAGAPGSGGSWATAFASLDAALAAAAANGGVDEIWVAAGTYTPSGRALSFGMVSDVDLFGGFAGTESSRSQRDWEANETILHGNGGNVLRADLTNGGTLDGFTLTGGNTGIGGGNGRGGGAFFEIAASKKPPTVRNCRFVGNFASEFGGGLYSNAGTTVANCVFIGNQSGTGSGLFMQGYGDDSRVVANCSFFGNGVDGNLSSGGGAEIWSDGDALIVNCVFSGNVADFGSGLSLVGDATIANCTFTGNTSRLSLGSSGLRASTSIADIVNCIFWNNRNADGPTEIAQISGYPTMNVRSCCVDSLETFLGNGNFDADPLFADHDGADNTVGTADDDLHLSGGSTSSGSGNPALLPPDAADLDGDGDRAEPTPVDRDGVPIANLSRGAFSS